jgi:hypothetical protein
MHERIKDHRQQSRRDEPACHRRGVRLYISRRRHDVIDQPKLERCIGRLNDHWGGKTLSQITTAECRAYVKRRGKVGRARADLETLRAAINHHAKENLHYGIVRVALPAKGLPRDRWLTRSEATYFTASGEYHIAMIAEYPNAATAAAISHDGILPEQCPSSISLS